MALIFDKYGGERFLDNLLNALYARNLSDSNLENFYSDKDVNKIKTKNRELLLAAFSPSAEHFSISVKRVHADLRITEEAFDSFVKNLNLELVNFKVQEEDIDEILIVVNSFKGDIVSTYIETDYD